MSCPRWARFGARDNMHALLELDGDPARLPVDLAGLTDQPPNADLPGDRWWPSVGCGPIEDLWAIWWTQPDEEAARAGMVRSEVALWSLDEIGDVTDLLPVLQTLSGQTSLPTLSVELLGDVVEALMTSDRRCPVLLDLDVWPAVLAALWVRLWPAARRAFSARVAISPPQGGESVAPPWIFGVPPDRAPQWLGHPIVRRTTDMKLSRAASWFVGNGDSTLTEVLTACGERPAKLGWVVKPARAADHLDRLRECASPANAVALLRTLITLAPTRDHANSLKCEALTVLSAGFARMSADVALSLANLDLSPLPEEVDLAASLRTWAYHQTPDLSSDSMQQLLDRLARSDVQTWWSASIRAGFAAGMEAAEHRWLTAALRWLGEATSPALLVELIPTTAQLEDRLLAVTIDANPAASSLLAIREHARERGWSRLHAWAAFKSLAPDHALRAQRTFPGDAMSGLRFLIERLPGAAIVEEVCRYPDDAFIALAATRTLHEPALLNSLDPASPAWRSLWTAHLALGGLRWPPDADRRALGSVLLDAVLAGAHADHLLVTLTEDLADVVLDHPQRAALWDATTGLTRSALLSRAATAFILRAASKVPEPPLLDAIVDQARATGPSALLLALLLLWSNGLSESEVIKWLGGPSRASWQPVAVSIGEAILARRWEKAAAAIYTRSMYMPELRPAVDVCQQLLTRWQRFLLAMTGGSSGSSREQQLQELALRTAELGADLFPDQLDDLWEQASGKRKYLPNSGTPAQRWREAMMKAQRGGVEGGILALVDEMLHDRSHNPELRELRRLLDRIDSMP